MKPEISKSPINNKANQGPLSDINRSSSNTPLRKSNDNPPISFRRGVRQSMQMKLKQVP